MGSTDPKSESWKEMISHQTADYAINVIYPTFVFAAIAKTRAACLEGRGYSVK